MLIKEDTKIKIDKRTLGCFSEFCYVKFTSNGGLAFAHGDTKKNLSLGYFPIHRKVYLKIKRQLDKEKQKK